MQPRAVWLLIGLAGTVAGAVFVGNALFLFVPPLAVFTLTLALSVGPVVVEERTKSSWELLLTIPYDMQSILLGKVSGALWHTRHLTYAMGILLMCISAGVGSISLILIPLGMTTPSSGRFELLLCGALFVLPVLGSLLFIVDRMQQYALMAVAALASSTRLSSIRAALSAATAAVLLIWAFEVVMTETILVLDQGGNWQPNATSIVLAATLGPVVSYSAEMSLAHAALYAVSTLLLREVLIHGLWWWALHSARV